MRFWEDSRLKAIFRLCITGIIFFPLISYVHNAVYNDLQNTLYVYVGSA